MDRARLRIESGRVVLYHPVLARKSFRSSPAAGAEPTRYRVFVGRVVNFLSATRLQDFAPGYLSVDPAGAIAGYGCWDRTAQRRWQGAVHCQCGDWLIMPGFVDTHLHLPQMHQRGIYGADLLQWLRDYILPAEARFAEPGYARRIAREFFAELLRNGTTCALVYSSVHRRATEIAFEEAARSGIRAIIGKVMMDRNVPAGLRERASDSVRESRELAARWHGSDRGRLGYAFAPRFAPACSDTLMQDAGRAAREAGAYLTSHLAETRSEIALTRRRFPGFRSYTDLYHRMGLLGPRTVMAHCIHLTAGEFRLLARTGTRVAHCPSANLFLHAGSMDLQRMERECILVGLGTDVGAGPSFSLFHVMQNTYFLRRIPPVRAFYLATLGGARVLSLDHVTGSFQIGKEADFLVAVQPESDRLQPSEGRVPIGQVLAQLMFRGDDRRILATFVRGRLVYRRRGFVPGPG
jgi:guanine deaminase